MAHDFNSTLSTIDAEYTQTLNHPPQEVTSNAVTSTISTVVPEPEALLPPCYICGEKATGYHYGAITCEPCKTFFRRSLTRKALYVCQQQNQCIIAPGRKRCSSCRLEKCKKFGMSKTAIRTGRYTHEKKTQVIEEVNRLKIQKLMTSDGMSCRLTFHRMKELDDILEQLTTVFLDKSHTDRVMFSEHFPKKEQEYVRRRAIESQMNQRITNIPNDEYKEIYRLTGIDIDGRHSILSRYVPSFEDLLKGFTFFCKQVPGFRRMCFEDQKAVMKNAAVECMLVQYAHVYNVEDGTCIIPYADDFVYSQDAVECLYNSKEDQAYVWSMFKRVQMLDLTDEERALVGAIVTMNADAELTAEGRRIASGSTEFLLEILLPLLDKNHDKEDRTLTRLISILTELRTTAQLLFGVNMFVTQNSNDWALPKADLFTEFFH